MRSVLSLIVGAALFLSLSACEGSLPATKKSAVEAAAAINGEFVAVRQAQQLLVSQITELYGRYDQLDLSTKGMDVSEGGAYEVFAGNKYYYKPNTVGSSVYASPFVPGSQEFKQRVRFLDYVDPFVQLAGKTSDVQIISIYALNGTPAVVILSPPLDVVSSLPPGLPLAVFEWYNRGFESKGPPVWSAKPFTDLTTGWVMDVSSPVRGAEGGEVKGVAVSSLDLAKLAEKHIKSRSSALVLMGPDTTVVGLTPEAVAILNVKPLQSVDYLKQMKENTFAPNTYLLTDSAQSSSIQQLGQAILSGQTEFAAAIDAKNYTVVVEPVVENGMLVVGLSPR